MQQKQDDLVRQVPEIGKRRLVVQKGGRRRRGRWLVKGWWVCTLAAGLVLCWTLPVHTPVSAQPAIHQTTTEVGTTPGTISQRFRGGGPLPAPPGPGDVLGGIITSTFQGFIDFVKKQFLDWTSSFGFMYVTPASLTYNLPIIQHASHWAIGVVDGMVVLLLVLGGYNVIMRQQMGLPSGSAIETLSRVLFTTIFANIGFFFVLPQLIELNNELCRSIWLAFGHAGMGDFTFPLGVINWAQQNLAFGVFIVIDFVVSLLLVLVQLVRVGLLDVLIVFAPLGIICAAIPQMQAFFRLWIVTFFCTLFVQVLQVGTVAVGTLLIASFTNGIFVPIPLLNGSSPIVPLVGIATTYIAFKLPKMLLSEALKVSTGSINQDVSSVVTKAANLAAFKGV